MPPIEVTTDGFQAPRWGVALLYCCVLFIFLLFLMRFWYLQILKGEEYSQLADSNRTRAEEVFATRGIIMDAKGRLLAENRPAYCLAITPEDCPDMEATLAQISMWTGLPLERVRSKYRTDIRAFEPQLLIVDLSFDQVAIIEQQVHQWPGISIVTRQRRYYPHGQLFAHILGYVSEANDQEIKDDSTLSLGDIVGKQGLEITQEKRLRGTKGLNYVEVDVLGRQLLKKQDILPNAGENLTLTLDSDLQKRAALALGAHAGSVVVIEPKTGKLRALVTTPAYDNNLFTTTLSHEDWNAIQNNPQHPLQNRTIQSTFPPGSVWKLMMVGLFLEQKISPSTTVFCSGGVTLNGHRFRCWRESGHGTINMMDALVVSCDTYFYEMSQKVGIDNIERYAKSSGFGALTGIDLPHERSGLVPSRAWKEARFNEPWQRGETLNISIGQGFTLVTPLQMAVFTAGILNEGILMKPLLIEGDAPEVKGQLIMEKAHRDFILDSMQKTSRVGTARRVNRQDALMGGKTGTAQVVKLGDRRIKSAETEYKYRDHAWITTWGMKEEETYVVVVMVEHGGGGGSTAGAVAALVYDALFGADRGPQKPKAHNSEV